MPKYLSKKRGGDGKWVYKYKDDIPTETKDSVKTTGTRGNPEIIKGNDAVMAKVKELGLEVSTVPSNAFTGAKLYLRQEGAELSYALTRNIQLGDSKYTLQDSKTAGHEGPKRNTAYLTVVDIPTFSNTELLHYALNTLPVKGTKSQIFDLVKLWNVALNKDRPVEDKSRVQTLETQINAIKDELHTSAKTRKGTEVKHIAFG